MGAVAVIGLLLQGWPGHDNPALRLGRVLTEAGHDVVAWTTSDLGVELPANPGGVGGIPQDGMHRAEIIYRLAARLSAVSVDLLGPTIGHLNAAKLDLLVHDSMAPWGRLAARWLGLPRICSLTHYPLPELGPLPAPAPQIVAALTDSRRTLLEQWGVELGDTLELVLNPGELTFLYTTPELLGLPSQTSSWRLVGPLLERAPDPRPRVDPPLVYVSMGTSFNRNFAAYGPVLDGLADLDVRVLVSSGGGFAADELGPVPANVTVSEWADTWHVLAEAALVVTHGGATSLHEAISAAVPLLVVPQAVDQPQWAERVAALGAGLSLDAPTPAEVSEAAARLLAEPRFAERATELRDHLLDYDGDRLAREAVESLIG